MEVTRQSVRRSTRKNIFDVLTVEKVNWHGQLDELEFLRRLFELDEMPSLDRRFKTAAQDIATHRMSFSDWPDDWVYSDPRFDLLRCDDETFLSFLCEIVHPVVNSDDLENARVVRLLNDQLASDNFELVERFLLGGRPVWSPRQRSLAGAAAILPVRVARTVFDSDYVMLQLTRMETAIEGDPSLAIGTAKELIETTCNAILEQRGRRPGRSLDLPKLVRLTCEELHLLPETVSGTSAAADAMRRVLGSLSTLAGGVAQLRNQFGTGHGHAPNDAGLSVRHARLVVGAASTLAVFLWETHLDDTARTTAR